MKIIKLSAASRSLAEYAADLTEEIVVLTERDKPVAALVPLKGADRDSVSLSGHPEFLKIIRRSRADFRRGRTMSLEEMKAAFADRSPNKRIWTPPVKKKVGRSRSFRR